MLELARASDWEAVKGLSIQIHEPHVKWRPDIYCHTEEPYPYETFLEDIHARQLFVAKVDGDTVGYAAFAYTQIGGAGNVGHKTMRINSIVVDKAFRGQGIGKQMIMELRALAKAFGCDQMGLSVYPQNDAAVSFYQKCGFQIRAITMDQKL